MKKLYHRLKNYKYLDLFIILFLISVYLFFRLYHHPERVNFAEDQGTTLITTWDMWHQKKLLLIGPKVSHGANGRFFFHGPYVYYLLLPGLLLSNWHPLGGSVITILLNLLGVVFLYLIGLKLNSKSLGFLLAVFYASNPFLIYYTSFIWNPNFLPTVSIVLSYLLLDHSQKLRKYKFFLLGWLLGFGTLLHYQMLLLLPLVLLFLFLANKAYFLKLFKFGIGFLLGLTPMIIFELKHNFYNLKTILFILKSKTFTSAGVTPFYFLAPEIVLSVLVIALLFKKLNSNKKGYLLATLFIVVLLNLVFAFKSLTFYPSELSLVDLEKASKIIVNSQVRDFNIVNLTTGNTRAYGLRYLLKYKNHPAMAVEDYPQAKHLFILARNDNWQSIADNPVWEVASFKGKVIQEWLINKENNYSLYLLSKE